MQSDEVLLWILGVIIVVLIGWVVYDEYQWSIYSEIHHCVRTGQSKDTLYMQPISTGTTTILVPQTITEYEFKCDGNELLWH